MKYQIKQLYNVAGSIKSYDDAKASAVSFTDASAGLVLQRNLEYVDPTIFEQKFPENRIFQSGISIDNSGGFSEVIKSLKVIPEGDFEDADDQGDNKGQITLKGSTNAIFTSIRSAESSWDKIGIERAKMSGVNIVQQFISAHLQKYQENIDRIGFLGNKINSNTNGLLTHPFETAPAGAAIETLSADDAYQLIVKDLINAQHTDVEDTEPYMGNNVVFPSRVYRHLRTLRFTYQSAERTVLEALKMSFPDVNFYGTRRAENVGGQSVTVCYSSNPAVMKLRVPMPLEFSALFERGFKFTQQSRFIIAGLDVLETAGGRALTGL